MIFNQTSMYSFFVILLVFSHLNFEVSSSSIGSRSILRKISDDSVNGEFHDVFVELNDTNFKDVLRETPATFAIVEFFAHWCPACRNYKPHYEKVARIFNGPDAAHPGILLMARVDCASKINAKLCDRFSVDRYPMLLWSRPGTFASTAAWDGNDGDIMSIKDGRTADRLLNWINKKMNSSYGFDDNKYEHEHLQSKTLVPEQIAQAVYDIEEATSSAFDIIMRHKMIKTVTKASLVRFLQLIAAHHPSRRCRKGSAEILVNFDDLYPPEIMADNKENGISENATKILGSFQICGKDVPRGYWMFCRGSRNDTRGFSCGLWVLLHSLSVKVENGESHTAFTTICEFIHNFFICEECREHFFDMCSRVDSPLNSTRDFALWLWDVHNQVNERLSKEEAALETGDPNYPKMIWPPKQLCPSCHLSQKGDSSSQVNWDKEEVFKFLASYYGKTLLSAYKDKDLLRHDEVQNSHAEEQMEATNPMVVSIGAALALAVASAAFGALTCYWRSQQKSRKYRHLHSLKNI
ncbi:sulfhydryl oxidase 2-like isoform X1 [Chenopodium quinoa]|uniref:sulfhydryl oxidase 2-like isoform X1 n=1 Tax=Chenopodium quinoa TaxID=63459 RepID=UPI000B76E26D|nr:sulfhydryl oxidase 2-like isoform X1 [Chenopodium quinoa]